MARKVEASEFYSRISATEKEFVKEITSLVVDVASSGEHHGAIVAVGGQLNKKGVRKDIDLKVCASDSTNTSVFREEIKQKARRLGADYLIRSVLVGNAEVPSLMIERPSVTPLHLILPSHSHDLPYPQSLKGLPLIDRKRYAIIAEF